VGGEVTGRLVEAESTPLVLIMVIPFALVIFLALRRQHIIVSLTWGSLATIVLGFVTGLMRPGEVFSIPAERGESTGLIESGISGVTGAVVLVLFILALAQLLADSGLMARILTKLERQAAKGVRSAELTIVGVSLLFSIPLGANAPAILLVGPTLARPLGMSHNLAPARTANLMDCSVCTVFYMLPWHNAVIVWFATLLVAAQEYGLPAPSIASAFLNPYAWALLVVLLISVITGWNRRYADESVPTAQAFRS
jgi:flagellin-like protein